MARLIVTLNFLLVLSFTGCTHPSTSTAAAVEGDSSKTVGVATMMKNRTVVLQLRSDPVDSPLAEGYFEYPPNHPEYGKILEHVGSLKPGQSVMVRPWPDTPKKS